jgi:hypothetical protein
VDGARLDLREEAEIHRVSHGSRGGLAAWERTVTKVSDKLWICVEYMGTESVYGTLNVGASWKFAQNVSMIGGYDIFTNDDLVNTIILQVDIDM